MSVRLSFAALAAGTAFLATGAAAQTIYYEDGDYLYAVPADTVVTETVEPVVTPSPSVQQQGAIVLPPLPSADGTQPVFTYDPVVQPVPGEAAVRTPGSAVRTIPARQSVPSYRAPTYADRAAINTVYAPPAYDTRTYAPGSYAPDSYTSGTDRTYPVYGGSYAYANAPRSGYLPGGGQLVSFDRETWLAECRARVGAYEDSDRARLIGTLVGAAAGGVVGNRVAGSGNRLGGTLIGAGTGAAAGSLVGDAIDDRSDARRYQAGYGDDGGYCAAYLDDYLARASQTAATTTTTVPGQQYFLVPVTVQVAQQPVYVD
ncbi:MAG: glycine zipper 2TM domain-containing protein [Erythrobacter sp.]|nr:glycine zipper 2TM domain-containing protein [Erythrobacter sp.]